MRILSPNPMAMLALQMAVTNRPSQAEIVRDRPADPLVTAHERSKKSSERPHQGTRECERRKRQMAKAKAKMEASQ